MVGLVSVQCVLAVVSLAEGSVCELLARFPSQLGSTLVTATLCLRSQLRVPIWLGAPRPAWRPDRLMKRGLPGFLGRYLVTVYVRMWFFYFLEFCALYL